MKKFNIYREDNQAYHFNSEEDADKYVELVNIYKYHNIVTPDILLKDYLGDDFDKEGFEEEVIDIPVGDVPDEFKNLYMIKSTPKVGFFMRCIYVSTGDQINKEIEELQGFYIAPTDFSEVQYEKGSVIVVHSTGEETFRQNISMNFKLASVIDTQYGDPKYDIYMSVRTFPGGIFNVVYSYIMTINYFREEYSGKNKADLAEICKKKCSLIPVNFNDSIIKNLTKCRELHNELTNAVNKVIKK